MAMKIWTTLTGVSEVEVHLSRSAAVTKIADFLAGCGVEGEVTAENWQKVLAGLNKEMEDATSCRIRASW
jgi:phosphopentomutase